MDESKWKKLNKPPACSKNPIEQLIPLSIRSEVVQQIKQECIDLYGSDILSECSKRKVCLSKSCLGRELPWKSPTALPYLRILEGTQNIQNGNLYVATDCSVCPIVKSCTSPCHQITDYITRDKVKEPKLINKDNAEKQHIPFSFDSIKESIVTNIPWDTLTPRRKSVIEMYLYDRRDFKYIAHSLNLNNQARAKYEYYAALTTIAEYTVMRLFFESNKDLLTASQKVVFEDVYYNNKSLCDVASNSNVSKQAVQQMLARVVKKHNISWPRFVKKKQNKVIYNIPQVLK